MSTGSRYLFLLCFSAWLGFAGPTLWVNDDAGRIGKVDVLTGAVTVVGNTGIVLMDIAFDTSGVLFGITGENLYRVNSDTGVANVVGPVGSVSGSFNALVFANDGILYGASDQLYRIDSTTGHATRVGAIGVASAGDLAFLNGRLYLTTVTNELVAVDTKTGAGTSIGSMGVQEIFGLASPPNGKTYGAASTNIYSVDPATGTVTLLSSYGGRGLSNAYGAAFLSDANTAVPEPGTFLLLMTITVAVLCAFFGPQNPRMRKPGLALRLHLLRDVLHPGSHQTRGVVDRPV